MAEYKAEDLIPGMMLRGSRGVVTLGRRLPNRVNKNGIEMVRFEGVGKIKTYSSAVGSPQYIIAVPAKKEAE
ncbi:hypothetical protein FMJ13_22930 [Klebsiella michiganensis]|uniref:hypothetical protein n=1 Tax=Klebsiella michiganensis TaxID=1134687 RepID=UPI001CCED742|nr:hypothetical protein [Klebsiella michiganensis]MBZ7334699.1 hypothetical protein [Klebsiella michiganensis]HEJ8417436.1 hypothetical protein [Klebsiella oxytoca]